MLHLLIVGHVITPLSMHFPQLVGVFSIALGSHTDPDMCLDCPWCGANLNLRAGSRRAQTALTDASAQFHANESN